MEQKVVKATVKKIIEVDGLQFKDLNGNGILDPYEDWRLPAEERAKDLVQQMSPREKAGMFFISDQRMGISLEKDEATSFNGLLSEVSKEAAGPLAAQFPTQMRLKDHHMRHLIVRENATAEQFAQWTNALQEVCEGTRLGIPIIVATNSKNENLEAHINFDDAVNKFTPFPGTLGIAAMNDLDLVKKFAEIGKREFLAAGLRKGYMYMVDTATDPRWFRTSGTFGEHPDQISEIAEIIIETYQGLQLSEADIALTIKHFPGGGARENGFDPHYAEGKFNVYPTEDSLENYHLPPFKAAISKNPASIMPYYAIPSNSKSATPQAPFDGEFEEEIAFAYNKQFIQDLLIDQLGFDGYVNSDTGVLGPMAWGAEDLNMAERAAKALNAGTNIISGQAEPSPFIDAILDGLVSREVVDARVEKLSLELFRLGLFDNPYTEVEGANDKVQTKEDQEVAMEAHRKSVVLLKNKDNLLPIQADSLTGKKVYVELFTRIYDEKEMKGRARQGIFGNTDEMMALIPKYFQERFPECEVVSDYKEADIAFLFVEPVSGSYFDATESYLELNINEETNVDLKKIQEIRQHVDKLIMNINFDLPMIVKNVEPLADAITAGFDTFISAIVDVMVGDFAPVGKLPITLPANDEAVAVDDKGICASPNDVPGYDKEKYMNGLAYVYTDSEGSRYEYGFGLKY